MTRVAWGRPTQSHLVWLTYHWWSFARVFLRVRWWRVVRRVTSRPTYPFDRRELNLR